MSRSVIITGKNNITYRARRYVQKFMGSIFPEEYMTKIYFRMKMKKRLNLANPATFNEKIQWYKLYYCADNDLVVQCSDKYAVREYISRLGYQGTLNRLIGVWDNVDDIDWDILPEKFVIKCNHGCGYNIICKDKSKLDRVKANSVLRGWMKEDFGLYNIEPHYNKIEKKILCEEFIETNDGHLPKDYKIFCFNGIPRVIGVYGERDSSLKRAFFDTEWNLLDISRSEWDLEITKPKLLKKALVMSETLARPFPFVRVDLYDCEERIIFGELTFSPAAGFAYHFLDSGDAYLGGLLKLPK